MKNDDFNPLIRHKLNQLASEHPKKSSVIHHVMDKVQKTEAATGYTWKLSGLALAAALTGLVVLPMTPNLQSDPPKQVNVDPKLSPQLLEDIDMLMVFAEDANTHGS